MVLIFFSIVFGNCRLQFQRNQLPIHSQNIMIFYNDQNMNLQIIFFPETSCVKFFSAGPIILYPQISVYQSIFFFFQTTLSLKQKGVMTKKRSFSYSPTHLTLVLIVAFVCFPTHTNSYSIEGEWELTELESKSQNGILMSIQDFVFRNSSIRWLMNFKACSEFKYIMEVEENNLFIDVDTFYEEPDTDYSKCRYEEIQTAKIIKEKEIKKVFSFQIISNFMIFSDAEGKVVMKFKRRVAEEFSKNLNQILNGNWMIVDLKGQKFQQLIQINKQKMTFCQRKATIEFQSIKRGQIKIKKDTLQNNGCGFQKLLVTIGQFQYYVLNNGYLEFFDQNDQLLASLNFVLDLNTSSTLKQEQDKKRADIQLTRQARLAQLQNQAIKASQERRIQIQKERAAILQELENQRAAAIQAARKAQIEEEQKLAALEAERNKRLKQLQKKRLAAIEEAKKQANNFYPMFLTGNWMIQSIFEERSSQLFEIDESTITFCQRKAMAPYKITQKGVIQIGKIINDECGFGRVLVALNSSKTYSTFPPNIKKVQVGTNVQFFNSEKEQTLSMNFVMDLQTARKLKEQQGLKKAQDEKLRQQRIQQLREQQRQRIVAQRAEEVRQAAIQKAKNEFYGGSTAQPRITTPPPAPRNNISIAPKLYNNATDLVGKWKINTIFRVPNFFENFQLIITQDTFLLSGGCNSHIVPYTTLKQTPNKLLLAPLRSTKQNCAQNDDGFFLTGLAKMQTFNVRIVGNQMQALIDDDSGKRVFQLSRQITLQSVVINNNQTSSNSQSSSQQRTPVSSVSSSNQNARVTVPVATSVKAPVAAPAKAVVAAPPAPQTKSIIEGRYRILLLKRRDLPLKIASLSNQILQFKVCNTLKFRLKPLQSARTDSQQKNIDVTLVDKVTPCDDKGQQVYIDAFRSIKTFRKSGLDVFFSNENGEDIISMGLV